MLVARYSGVVFNPLEFRTVAKAAGPQWFTVCAKKGTSFNSNVVDMPSGGDAVSCVVMGVAAQPLNNTSATIAAKMRTLVW